MSVDEMLTPDREEPLCYVDHAEDDIHYGHSRDFDNLPRESDCALEIHLQQFLSAVEMHPFYLADILPSTYNRSLWDAERIRLAALLLDEAEAVRQLPTESRDWDFVLLGL